MSLVISIFKILKKINDNNIFLISYYEYNMILWGLKNNDYHNR